MSMHPHLLVLSVASLAAGPVMADPATGVSETVQLGHDGALAYMLAPPLLSLLVALLLWRRQIGAQFQVLTARLALRVPARHRPVAATSPAKLAPARQLGHSRGIEEDVKRRMTQVHQKLRMLAPELLPVFAHCRAAQMQVFAQTRHAPAAEVAATLIGGLVQIETATHKLSLVLGTTTKEHAFGNFADTLEKLTSETLDCLVSLRADTRTTRQRMQIGGEAERA